MTEIIGLNSGLYCESEDLHLGAGPTGGVRGWFWKTIQKSVRRTQNIPESNPEGAAGEDFETQDSKTRGLRREIDAFKSVILTMLELFSVMFSK